MHHEDDLRPLVVAHRGASAAAPENTLEAFALAATLGADWVELDVRVTSDHVLVVHHDPHLGDGRVIVDTPAHELPASVPTLAAALDVCDAAGLGVNVEIKGLPGEPDLHRAPWLAGAVAELLLERLSDRAPGSIAASLLVTSFLPATIDAVRLAGGVWLPTGLLALDLSDPATVIAVAVDGGHRALNPWNMMTTGQLVEDAHDAGLEVNVWTVDDPVRMTELVDWGVDALITNTPDVARTVVGHRAG